MKISSIKLLQLLFVLLFNSLAGMGQKTIKILSYNVLYGLQQDSVNIERYKSLIRELAPDIVATQEMNGWKQKTLEELAGSYGHPYALQSKETGYPVALTSKTPMVNFKKVTENVLHSYIYAKIQGIHIFVLHLSPSGYQKRLEEADEIIAQARELPAREPILIMGDFNALDASDSAYYGETTLLATKRREEKYPHLRNLNQGRLDYSVMNKFKEAGFKDSFKVMKNEFTGSMPTFKDGEGKIQENETGMLRRIDYVWCNATAVRYLTKSVILKNELTRVISDHYPVYVELILPGKRNK